MRWTEEQLAAFLARRQAQARALERCAARMPERFPAHEPQPAAPGGQCGLPAGHRGPHTLLIPTGMPWLRPTQRPSRAPDEPEARFQSRVIALAKRAGWLVYFTHRSTHSPAGYPDLCMVKPASATSRGRLIYAELKVGRGKLSTDQMVWLEALRHSVPGVECYCFYPKDWETIVTLLA